MKRTVLYQNDLNGAQCQKMGCQHLHGTKEPVYLHSQCHTADGLEVSYHQGVLKVACAQCKKLVTEIAVAERPGLLVMQ